MNKVISTLAKDLYASNEPIQNVYLHIPFCQKKCHFCAFPIHAIGTIHSQHSSQLMSNYLIHLKKQITFTKSLSVIDLPLKSLYLGGGTPSLYAVNQLTNICSLFNINSQTQVTIEINPTQLKILPELIKTKINRWSFGIQTFNKQILQKMNRQHVPFDQLIEGISLYRPKQISIDFILDFNVEEDSFNAMLKFISLISPEHITIYMLQTNEGSQLFNNRSRFQWLPKDQILVEKFIQMNSYLTELGYDHYEVCNFSKTKKNQSVHSSVYWQGTKQFLAFGMGSTSLNNGLRVTRPKTIKKYQNFVNNLSQNATLSFNQLSLQCSDQREWQVKLQSLLMSGLRRKMGVSWQKINDISTIHFQFVEKVIMEQLKQIEEAKSALINWTQIYSTISLTVPQGFLFADYIILRLIEALNKRCF